MTAEPHPPPLFDGRPPTEILVPAIAEFHYERGIALAAHYAGMWNVPIRLVHVRVPSAPTSVTALDAAVSGLTSANPELVVDGVEVEADDVVSGIEATSTDRSLIILASDEGSQWLERGSISEALLARADKMLLMAGAGCQEGPTGTSVIVPLDGSVRAEAALEPAIAVAGASNAKLCVTTVVPPAVAEAVSVKRGEGEEVSESGYLRSVTDRLAEEGIDAGWEVVHHGDPVAGINTLARDQGSAMIVAATHGQSGVAKRVFGSICLGLVERGSAPVLVVKTDVADAIPLAGARPV